MIAWPNTRSGPSIGNRMQKWELLGEGNYGPGSGPQWKTRGTCYSNLYKALLEEPSRTRRTKLLEDNLRAKEGGGHNVRRPVRVRIRNH